MPLPSASAVGRFDGPLYWYWTQDGLAWQHLTPQPADLQHVIWPRPGVMWALASTSNPTLYVSTAPGHSWAARSPIGSLYYLTLVEAAPDLLLAMGNTGIRRSTDGGWTWTSVTVKPSQQIRQCQLWVTQQPGCVFALVPFNEIWRSTDYGATWAQVYARGDRYVNTAWVDPLTGYCFCAISQFSPPDTIILRSVDHGATWGEVAYIPQSTGDTNDTIRTRFGRIGNRLIYARRLQSLNNGATWSEVSSLSFASAAMATTAAAVYTGNAGDPAVRSTDGLTWTSAYPPLYAPLRVDAGNPLTGTPSRLHRLRIASARRPRRRPSLPPTLG